MYLVIQSLGELYQFIELAINLKVEIKPTP